MGRNLRWRTRRFVERATGLRVETVRLVEQLTTSVGEFFVLSVRTDERRYWVVAESDELALYPKDTYASAEEVLQGYLARGAS
jgi:hypothetical protein